MMFKYNSFPVKHANFTSHYKMKFIYIYLCQAFLMGYSKFIFMIVSTYIAKHVMEASPHDIKIRVGTVLFQSLVN